MKTIKTCALALLSAIAVVAVMSQAGLIENGESKIEAQRRLDAALDACMRRKGVGEDDLIVEQGDVQSRTQKFRINELCWKETLASGEFVGAGTESPSTVISQLRDEGFRSWKCIENAGFLRTDAIPLSGRAGYPLLPTVGHFRVGESESAIESFYRTASKCSSRPIDAFRDPDGEFLTTKADGRSCLSHTHGGKVAHSHGCFATDTYPKALR